MKNKKEKDFGGSFLQVPLVNDFKISNTSLSVLKSNVGFQGWDSQTASQNRKRDTLTRPLLQMQSDLDLHCLSNPFLKATSVQNFRTFSAL